MIFLFSKSSIYLKMFFNCKLCNQWSITRYICEDCNKIKDMINLYSRDTIIDVLDAVLVRDTIKRNYKIDMIKKKGLETDNSNDREYKEENKKEDKKEEKIKIDTSNYNHITKNMMAELRTKLDNI